jgi:hypothetical protein
MDIDLSADDLAFEKEVREFLSENAYTHGANPEEWRMKWF